MGGHTASVLLGARHKDPHGGTEVNLAEHRIKAGVLLAAPGIGDALSKHAAEHYSFFSTIDFSKMTTPALVVAGRPGQVENSGHRTRSTSGRVKRPRQWRRRYPSYPCRLGWRSATLSWSPDRTRRCAGPCCPHRAPVACEIRTSFRSRRPARWPSWCHPRLRHQCRPSQRHHLRPPCFHPCPLHYPPLLRRGPVRPACGSDTLPTGSRRR